MDNNLIQKIQAVKEYAVGNGGIYKDTSSKVLTFNPSATSTSSTYSYPGVRDLNNCSIWVTNTGTMQPTYSYTINNSSSITVMATAPAHSSTRTCNFNLTVLENRDEEKTISIEHRGEIPIISGDGKIATSGIRFNELSGGGGGGTTITKYIKDANISNNELVLTKVDSGTESNLSFGSDFAKRNVANYWTELQTYSNRPQYKENVEATAVNFALVSDIANQTIQIRNTSFGSDDVITFDASGAASLTVSDKTVYINASDTHYTHALNFKKGNDDFISFNQESAKTIKFAASGDTTLNTSVDGSSGTLTIETHDTKNTAGATWSSDSSTLYLIGVTASGTNPQTYANKYFKLKKDSLTVGFNYQQGNQYYSEISSNFIGIKDTNPVSTKNLGFIWEDTSPSTEYHIYQPRIKSGNYFFSFPSNTSGEIALTKNIEQKTREFAINTKINPRHSNSSKSFYTPDLTYIGRGGSPDVLNYCEGNNLNLEFEHLTEDIYNTFFEESTNHWYLTLETHSDNNNSKYIIFRSKDDGRDDYFDLRDFISKGDIINIYSQYAAEGQEVNTIYNSRYIYEVNNISGTAYPHQIYIKFALLSISAAAPNDARITLNSNGSLLDSFTLNQSSDQTINISNQTIKANNITFSASSCIDFIQGDNITIAASAGSSSITFNATDTKNTIGATFADASATLYFAGATSSAANIQSYLNNYIKATGSLLQIQTSTEDYDYTTSINSYGIETSCTTGAIGFMYGKVGLSVLNGTPRLYAQFKSLASKTYNLPSSSGTLALLSDIKLTNENAGRYINIGREGGIPDNYELLDYVSKTKSNNNITFDFNCLSDKFKYEICFKVFSTETQRLCGLQKTNGSLCSIQTNSNFVTIEHGWTSDINYPLITSSFHTIIIEKNRLQIDNIEIIPSATSTETKYENMYFPIFNNCTWRERTNNWTFLYTSSNKYFIKYFKIYDENNNLIFDLVPVLDNIQDVSLYDKINQSEHLHNELIAGPIVERPTKISYSGPEPTIFSEGPHISLTTLSSSVEISGDSQFALITNTLTNINGYRLNDYNIIGDTSSDSLIVQYQNTNCDASRAKFYLLHMTGGDNIPIYDEDLPRYCCMTDLNGTIYRPVFNSEGSGLILQQHYIYPTLSISNEKIGDLFQ